MVEKNLEFELNKRNNTLNNKFWKFCCRSLWPLFFLFFAPRCQLTTVQWNSMRFDDRTENCTHNRLTKQCSKRQRRNHCHSARVRRNKNHNLTMGSADNVTSIQTRAIHAIVVLHCIGDGDCCPFFFLFWSFHCSIFLRSLTLFSRRSLVFVSLCRVVCFGLIWFLRITLWAKISSNVSQRLSLSHCVCLRARVYVCVKWWNDRRHHHRCRRQNFRFFCQAAQQNQNNE